jgi:hypothetical protein
MGGGENVTGRLDLGRRPCRDLGTGTTAAPQEIFHSRQPLRPRPRAEDDDSATLTCGPDEREVTLSPSGYFREAEPLIAEWNDHLDQEFVRFQAGHLWADHEVIRGDLPSPADRCRDDDGIQRKRNRGPFRGGVHVRQRTADGSTVPDLKMPDVRDRGSDQGRHAGVMLYVALPCHGADAQSRIRFRYLAQLGDPLQIDYVARSSNPHREKWYQALSARQRFGLIAQLSHHLQGLAK